MPENRTDAPHVPDPNEPAVPTLEEDESIAPRPEEEIADVVRAEPDTSDHRAGHG